VVGGGAVTVRIGVIQFPGSNCEHDVVAALAGLGAEATIVWHGDRCLDAVDGVVLPGGFAHGDYLRPGALARFSPIMAAVTQFAAAGGPVVGICNGFQVLTEAGLLPGALQKNRGLTFLCRTEGVEVVSDRSALTTGVAPGTRLRIPINHFEGNYTCDAATLADLRRQGRIVLRYIDNPNGSVDDIAGICNDAGNVVGLMPHPERASDALLGSTDGQVLLRALLQAAGAPTGSGTSAPIATTGPPASPLGPSSAPVAEPAAPTPAPAPR
jgi:phosphoribosylformylglycinamidine synthase